MRRPRIVEMRERFGAAGPLLVAALILEVERTAAGRATGRVEAHYPTLAEMVAVPEDEVRAIVQAAADLGLISITSTVDPMTGRQADVVTLRAHGKWSGDGGHGVDTTPRRIPTDARVISAVTAAGCPMSGREIAEAIDRSYCASLRRRLARLRHEGRLDHERGRGYVIGSHHA